MASVVVTSSEAECLMLTRDYATTILAPLKLVAERAALDYNKSRDPLR
eukprot:SAG31_NODE_904_length_11120_cov_76.575084_7_plen_48_part_00